MASANLSKTPGSAGNRKKFNFSFWIKGNDFVSDYMFFSSSGSTESSILFDSSSRLEYYEYNGSSKTTQITTNRFFRDPSAWYHIVISVDTTQNTSSDRVKIYVNGTQETSLANSTYSAQDFQSLFNNTTTQYIGSNASSGNFDGSMTHIHFNDGYTYDASTFGETDSTSGIWKPKTLPSVTYGSNGYFLKFENSGAMGTDSSGNSNTYAVGGTITQNVDTPSNNFSTLNPLHKGNTLTGFSFANSNNTVTFGSTSYPYTFSTQAVSSGKWYAEFKAAANATTVGIGISAGEKSTYFSHSQYDYAYYGYNGNIQSNQAASPAGYGSALSNNDILGVAMDLDNNKLYFSINGTFQNSGVPTSGSTGTGAKSISASSSTPTGVYHFSVGDQNTQAGSVQCNFGSGFFGTTAVASANADGNGFGAFEYAVPSGYYALCTKNIKEFG